MGEGGGYVPRQMEEDGFVMPPLRLGTPKTIIMVYSWSPNAWSNGGASAMSSRGWLVCEPERTNRAHFISLKPLESLARH